MRQIVWFHDYTEQDRVVVGGKNAALGAMTVAALPVPPGFAVTTHAFESSFRESGCLERICGELEAIDVRDLQELGPAAARARQIIVASALTKEVTGPLRAAYARLCERVGEADVPVAVRSSASCEDTAAASCAGQQDTELWVRGADRVADAVRRCWASLFNDRAVAYRAEHGVPQVGATIGVGIQQMIRPKAAGIVCTLDPSNGDRSKVVIESTFGFGEGVASGSVTPDHFVVDKVVSEIVHRRVAVKEREFVLDDEYGRVVERPLDPGRAGSPSISDDEVLALVEVAGRIERHFGCPQDIEWGIESSGSTPGPVTVLQARPETVWANRPRRRIATVAKGLADGVLTTLLRPVKVGGGA